MRFDDSLSTVLSADASTASGAQSAWRQLVDLLGRGRVRDPEPALARLRTLREQVPAAVRTATARALAMGEPPLALVALFAEDEIAVAAPVLRGTTLAADDWLALLPALTPQARAVLRHRRDLPATVMRGLDSFGRTDFVLAHDAPAAPKVAATEPVSSAPAAPLDTTPFVAVGEAARAIPLVAEALKQAAEPDPRFEIAELVARIDAYQRTRSVAPDLEPAREEAGVPDCFRFASDAQGVIRWVDGVARGPLIGVTLARAGEQGAASLDRVPAQALRGRAPFRDARLDIEGGSAAAGAWRLAAQPSFDAVSGQFTGMSGIARRRAAERVEPAATAADQLRQLVHELRTPANAIAGFAELIGSELLGAVPSPYRDRALLIQRQAGDLIGAIEDLDTAARLEDGALDLRPGEIDLAALVQQAATEVSPLAAERGAMLIVDAEPAPAFADDRVAQRLVTRLLGTLVAAAVPGERLRAQVSAKPRGARLSVTRPRTLTAMSGEALLAIDGASERDGESLLGTGFSLRLARNLATELGGRLVIEADRVTLRLPLARDRERAALG